MPLVGRYGKGIRARGGTITFKKYYRVCSESDSKKTIYDLLDLCKVQWL